MGYETTNPPTRVAGEMAGFSIWMYNDADADGTVVGSDYFSNGDALGMKVGDLLLAYDTGGDTMTLFSVQQVTSGGAAQVKVVLVTT